jgi:hypothetical protein
MLGLGLDGVFSRLISKLIVSKPLSLYVILN